jgi:hypothetical protein
MENTETIPGLALVERLTETPVSQANLAPAPSELGFVVLLRNLFRVAPKQQTTTERPPMPSDDMDSEWVSWLQ